MTAWTYGASGLSAARVWTPPAQRPDSRTESSSKRFMGPSPRKVMRKIAAKLSEATALCNSAVPLTAKAFSTMGRDERSGTNVVATRQGGVGHHGRGRGRLAV